MAEEIKLNNYFAFKPLRASQLNNDNGYFQKKIDNINSEIVTLNNNKLNGLIYPGSVSDKEIDIYKTNAQNGYVTFLVYGGNQIGEGLYSVRAILKDGEITLSYTSLDDSVDTRFDEDNASANYEMLQIGTHTSGEYKHICINREKNSSTVKVVEIANVGFEAIDPKDATHDPIADKFKAGYQNKTIRSYGKPINTTLSINDIIESGVYEIDGDVGGVPSDTDNIIEGTLYVLNAGEKVYQTLIYIGKNGYSVKSRYRTDAKSNFTSWENMLSPIIKFETTAAGSKVLNITTKSKFN